MFWRWWHWQKMIISQTCLFVDTPRVLAGIYRRCPAVSILYDFTIIVKETVADACGRCGRLPTMAITIYSGTKLFKLFMQVLWVVCCVGWSRCRCDCRWGDCWSRCHELVLGRLRIVHVCTILDGVGGSSCLGSLQLVSFPTRII